MVPVARTPLPVPATRTPCSPRAQRDHYQTFGYVILRGYFAPAEVDTLREQLVAQLAREHPNPDPAPGWRDFCCMLGEHCTAFHGLLEDPRFLDVAEQLHGRSLPVWCDGNRYSMHDTGWHPDILAMLPDALDHAGVKFIHYLEPLRADDGALRVIPGSHRRPMHDSVAAYLKDHGPAIAELPAVACETNPGDVVAFHHGLFHAATGVRSKRLMHTLAYYPLEGAAPFLAAVGRLYRGELLPAMHRDMRWAGEIHPGSWIAGARIVRAPPRHRHALA